MIKILQARLQWYVKCELQDVQAGFRKGRGTRDKIANIRWVIKKAREFQKTSISALLTMPKPLTMWICLLQHHSSKATIYRQTLTKNYETFDGLYMSRIFILEEVKILGDI